MTPLWIKMSAQAPLRHLCLVLVTEASPKGSKGSFPRRERLVTAVRMRLNCSQMCTNGAFQRSCHLRERRRGREKERERERKRRWLTLVTEGKMIFHNKAANGIPGTASQAAIFCHVLQQEEGPAEAGSSRLNSSTVCFTDRFR